MVKHGTRSKYNMGCRCIKCKIANRLYGRKRFLANGDINKKKSRSYYLKNRKKIIERSMVYYKNNRKAVLARMKLVKERSSDV